MRRGVLCVAVAVVALLCGTVADAQTWNLVWSDEFDGSSVNGSNWSFETGGGGWGNNELEYYQSANASVAGGVLTIQARQQSMGGYAYTSARMNTAGKRSYTYGRIEARLAGPSGQGLWPAFWMLGSNFGSVGWPGCGEIDVMEHINAVPNVYGTIHWDSGGYVSYGAAAPAMNSFGSYHSYAVEWTPSAITWLLDGTNVGAANILNSINGTDEFHRPFFLILNLAVGGNWPGSPDGSTVFPANLNVDYVRVYQQGAATPTPTATATPAPGSLLSLGKPASASSAESASYAAGYAVDGSTATRWSSAFSDPQWISVDLGSTAAISRVRLNWEAAFATSYQIQVSNDNVSWATVKSVTGGDGGIDDHNLSTSGRYVRIYGTARATAYGYSLWEMEVYGTAGDVDTHATATPTSTTGPSATPTATPAVTATPTNTPTATATPTSGGGGTTWAPGTAYATGALVTYNGVTYRCLQAHTSLVGWEPPNVPALWAVA